MKLPGVPLAELQHCIGCNGRATRTSQMNYLPRALASSEYISNNVHQPPK